MKTIQLSDEAYDVALSMIEYCINNGIRMGMNEGIDNGQLEPFRQELEQLLLLGSK